MKFRKRPIVVEAERFTDAHLFGHKPLPAGVTKESDGDSASMAGALVRFCVTTAHGQKAYLEPGDWIIAEPDGRGYYPCKPDIFAATFSRVPKCGYMNHHVDCDCKGEGGDR